MGERGDKEYLSTENYVLKRLLKLSGQTEIARLQGSGSLAIEIMILNFLYGKVLIVDTGYYSDRLKLISKQAKKTYKHIKSIKSINWEHIDTISEKFDWILGCPTETSCGLRVPIKELYKLKKKTNSKLMLDATASIGLETGHNLADVISFSSCKGLFWTYWCMFCFFLCENSK